MSTLATGGTAKYILSKMQALPAPKISVDAEGIMRNERSRLDRIPKLVKSYPSHILDLARKRVEEGKGDADVFVNLELGMEMYVFFANKTVLLIHHCIVLNGQDKDDTSMSRITLAEMIEKMELTAKYEFYKFKREEETKYK